MALSRSTRMTALAQNIRAVRFHLMTLFLFTKTDFKAVILPQSLFALAIFPMRVQSGLEPRYLSGFIPPRMPYAVAWLWLHLLVENISNQRLPASILEDKANKPWRPIPSGRLTAAEAKGLLRALVPLALLASVLMGSFTPSAALLTLIWLYNDLEGSSIDPLQRNVINAAAFACFGWGGAGVLLSGSSENEELQRNWGVLTTAAVMSTIHVQDFPDMVGDTASGRRTAPLVYGEGLARWSLAVLVPSWSIACLVFWGVPLLAWVALLGMASIIAAFTLTRRYYASDELVWKLWCFWLCVVYLLPLFSNRME
ncbi:UbiA prenyltransferase family-domain-containing protein [Durotheca rogersii]|uniref:UbiA prenyltransferase family-domain-containing protein n=1 Tax=Durotheca rogersii TaxID=419775 RepID=UPI00221F380D|nr:UbiA prenyltransferase family-domain-containing protein [Durotheca rogersii]KAI5859746.1 UbiA prenyltransferase family-domain-containing protein [Durotheca rogersii]